MAGRKARNTGHKALRARAVVELADLIGWERAHGVYYMGVPDMAVGPLYYSLYDAACVMVTNELPGGREEPQADEPDAAHRGARSRRWSGSSWRRTARRSGICLPRTSRTASRSGASGDTIQIGAAELILRTTVPRQFTDGQHAFDYCNAANSWMRTSDNPYQARMLYLMASFVNDVARSNKLFTPGDRERVRGIRPRGPDAAGAAGGAGRGHPGVRRPAQHGAAQAYLKSGADRQAYQAAVAVTACKFQDDPHNQKITLSAFEEYGHNSSHLRDRLLLAAVRLLAGWPKMPGERECYARFMKEWINN